MKKKIEAHEDHHSLLKEFEHRMKLVVEADRELKEQYNRNTRDLSLASATASVTQTKIKEEISELQKLILELKKTLVNLGKTLKTKITKKELEELSSRVDKWQLEEYVQQKELSRLYNKYAP